MEFRVLGAVEVVVGGQTVALGGSRERAVLARLLVSANQVVAQDTLVGDLWPGDEPEGGIPALQAYVYRLRKALRSSGRDDVLLTRRPGYLLAVDPDAVDAIRFDALVRSARRSAADLKHSEAAATFSEALALWRGPPYPGLTELPFARVEAARLEEARLGALEARIEADLACGRHDELIGELAALTGEHPLRERLWALRMTALYRAGRQAESLRAYQELRRHLGDELGIEPSDELRTLEGAILRQDAQLGQAGRQQASSPGTIAAGEVQWTPAAAPVLPLPVALARQDSVFVRPEADMARLEAAWQATQSGRRQLVLLAGEPGIGKTRRSAEIARAAHEAEAVVLHGRCEEGLGVPYQPFVEALGSYLRHVPAPVLGRLAGELVRLAPEVGIRFPDLPPPLSADPETERYRLFDAVAAWLAAVADAAPTMLVIDDIHWATPPTLAMLTHLVRSGEPGRLLLVVNYRDTELDMTPALADAVADLLRQPDVDRVRLGGLDRAGVAAYIAARAGHDLDAEGQELAGVLHAETAGNPFYLIQVLRHLGETGALTRRDGRWSPAGAARGVDVPDSVRDVIARRLARLPEETGEILALAAVQGDRFDLAVLVEAAGQADIAVLSALDPAVGARLVTEADGSTSSYRFVHALVRHTVEDGLSAARRLQYHRATGAALAAVAGDDWRDHAADLARHWLAATPTAGVSADDARRTLDYAQEAAHRAVSSLAYEEAAAQLARALPLAGRLEDPARRAALLVALGEAQHHAGDPAHRQTLLDAARLALELDDADLAARAALANQRPLSILGAVDPERLTLLDQVIEALPPDDSTVRARVLVAMASELHWSTDPRRDHLAREAVAVARRLGDPAGLAQVLGIAVYALWEAANLPERVEIATELSELAGQLGDPVLQVDAGLALYHAAAQHGDFARARMALASATPVAEALGQPALRLRAAMAQMGCAMLDGRFEDCLRFNNQALQFAEALGHTDRLGLYHGTVGLTRLVQGRATEAIEPLAAALGAVSIASVKSALLWAYAEAGRDAEAATLLDSLEETWFSDVARNYQTLHMWAALAEACGALGARALAGRVHPQLLPYRDQMVVGQISGFGPVAHHLGVLAGLLGSLDEADEHFAAAAELQERTGARGFLTRTRLEWARVLLARGNPGDRERARDLAAAARQLALELDSPALADQASELAG